MAIEQGRLAVGGGGDEEPQVAALKARPEDRLEPQSEPGPEAVPEPEVEEVKFEEAFARLEVIVRRLEAGDLSLDDSLRLFEEGIALSRVCSRRLDEAEAKIELLLQNKEGGVTAVPFENPPGANGEGEHSDAG